MITQEKLKEKIINGLRKVKPNSFLGLSIQLLLSQIENETDEELDIHFKELCEAWQDNPKQFNEIVDSHTTLLIKMWCARTKNKK